MASPQKENGYSPIANELFEAKMKVNIPPYSSAIWDAIVRMTYGYSQPWAFISRDMFVSLTGINPRHIHRAQNWLLVRNMIKRHKEGKGRGGRGKASQWAIQKDYDSWKLFKNDKREFFNSFSTNSTSEGAVKLSTNCTSEESKTAPPPVSETAPVQVHLKTIKTNKARKPLPVDNSKAVDNLSAQVHAFRARNWSDKEIKDFLLEQKTPEAIIDMAMGKKF